MTTTPSATDFTDTWPGNPGEKFEELISERALLFREQQEAHRAERQNRRYAEAARLSFVSAVLARRFPQGEVYLAARHHARRAWNRLFSLPGYIT